MSRRSEPVVPARRVRLPAVLLAATVLVASAGFAVAAEPVAAALVKPVGLVNKDAPKEAPKAAPAPKDAAVTAMMPRASGKKPVMRCWQEGKLVFEGAGMMPAGQGQATIELRNGNAVSVQLFDLKNALCLLDYGTE